MVDANLAPTPMPDPTNAHAAVAERIRAHLERERNTLTKVTELAQVPSSVDALTPEWWTAVLCAGVPDARVTAHAIVDGSSGTHARHRHALEYNEAGRQARLPSSVFTKSLPDLVTRMIGGYNGTARAEGRFYVQIRPTLEIETPLGYHAAFDRQTFAGINVMEDIAATRGAVFCSHRTLVTRPMAEQMIDLLAALHAGTWEHARFESDWRWVTLHPSSARRSAMARPMPCPPPVTMVVLPVNPRTCASLGTANTRKSTAADICDIHTLVYGMLASYFVRTPSCNAGSAPRRTSASRTILVELGRQGVCLGQAGLKEIALPGRFFEEMEVGRNEQICVCRRAALMLRKSA